MCSKCVHLNQQRITYGVVQSEIRTRQIIRCLVTATLRQSQINHETWTRGRGLKDQKDIGLARKPINHTSWVAVAVVIPTVRPKSVRNRCIIELFVALFVLSLCPNDISVGIGAFVIGLRQIKTKRRRSDSVLWQKPLHLRKCQKGSDNTNNATKKFD